METCVSVAPPATPGGDVQVNFSELKAETN
jgi:hypothetical protein